MLKDILKAPNLEKTLESQYLTENEERNEYIKWFRELDIAYHLTVTFQYITKERKTVEVLNKLLHRLNLKIYRKRYQAEKNSLKGVAVMEDTPGMETVHFHIMILKEPHLPNRSKLEQLLEAQFKSLGKQYPDILGKYQLDSYYRSVDSSLENYLTKLFDKKIPLENVRDRFAVLGPNPVVFGDGSNLSRFGS